MDPTVQEPNTPSKDFTITLDEISKIEGAASLDIVVRDGTVKDLKFSISEWKRFYTEAIKGKPLIAVPQLVARICGTCSNAHLLAAILAIEDMCSITPSAQTTLLRKLLYYGLIIRDHALHLYVFALPDLFKKASILDLDESDPQQKQLLEDTFAVKEVGNRLAIETGGRSVHAPFAGIGGFLKYPPVENLKKLIDDLKTIRPRILALIDLFSRSKDSLIMKNKPVFSALKSSDFSFLDGTLVTSTGLSLPSGLVREHMESIIIPYSHARGFTFDGSLYLVGALSRLNLSATTLHSNTAKDAAPYLTTFPSENIFHNNIAQAIEILHAIDASIDLINQIQTLSPEPPITKLLPTKEVGVGVIEAPRGTLYYRFESTPQNTIKQGEIIVPTGQNQLLMEHSLKQLVEGLVRENRSKENIIDECENLIRAYDPCMSCASHFLKVRWL